MMFVLNVLCGDQEGGVVVTRGAYNMADVIALEDISTIPSREHAVALIAVRLEGGTQVLCADTFDTVLAQLQVADY